MRCDIKALHATSKNDIPAVKEPSVGLIQADSKRPYGVTLKPLKDERCRRHGTSQWPTDICAHYDRTVTSQTADTAAEAVHLSLPYYSSVAIDAETVGDFDTHCCHMGTAILCQTGLSRQSSFVIFDIRAL